MVRPLEGKTAIVTGATSGIGFEASVKFATLGAHVVLGGRHRSRGEAALAAVKERAASAGRALLFSDFSSLKQIRGLGSEIVYLAASPEVEGQSGGYYEKHHKVDPSRLAQDTGLAQRLWEYSAALVQDRSSV